MAQRINIEVRRQELASCLKCPNHDVRNEHCEEGVCELKSTLDSLPIRCVGEWANDKIYYLTQYFGIFATGMHKKWPDGLHYIEVCSGPGRCSTRDGFEQDGTAVAVLNHPAFQYIKNAVYIDYNIDAVNALNKRIKLSGQATKAQAFLGDYNNPESIVNAIGRHEPRSLSLCLVDPTDCSLPFDTIEQIYNATNQHCDFIISFFDKTDLNRNCVMATLFPSHIKLKEKYERFLGDRTFFLRPDIIEMAKLKQNDRIVSEFTEAYKKNLKKIGLIHSEMENVGVLYRLLFATSNPKGIEFWTKANKTCLPSGQKLFNF